MSRKSSFISVIQLKLWNLSIKYIQCTQTEVDEVFGSFNRDYFGSHLTNLNKLEYGDML